MSRIHLFIIGAVALISTGCANITNDKVQSVSVNTPACPGATCKLSNPDGQYAINKTPGTVMVNKAYGDLKVECSKGDVKSTNFVKSSANYSNLLLGGAIRAAKMDFGSGAGFDYPTSVQNSLQCKKE